jgi:phosphohistidine phosphatase
MEVFLVRHAIAHERNRTRWPNDALRPLTSAGIKKFRVAARGLADQLPRGIVVLTSPYVRARETAEILVSALHRARLVESAEIASNEAASKAFDLLRTRKEKAVVLVGHEPNCSVFLSIALGGERARFKIDFKKGGAACVEFAKKIEPGQATLRWMLPPRVLRALD